MKQATSNILMIRPVNFQMNAETAVNNFFQKQLQLSPEKINQKAQQEFDDFVKVLRDADINVFVFDDLAENQTPDSIFPNNWVSFHENSIIALYPMFAENRRRERRTEILADLEEEGFVFEQVFDYTAAENEGVFLEGTGSLILDRVNKKAYCALSPRANEELLIEFCEDFEYLPIPFFANQTMEGKRLPIYHTNVMMCIAEKLAIVCFETIDDIKEQKLVTKSLKEDGKTIISITEGQMNAFAGNMLQVNSNAGDSYLVMSTSAFNSLTDKQIKTIESHLKILHSPLTTIETLGGGSARCMMAEIFNPKQ
jgi:hypothetical protein